MALNQGNRSTSLESIMHYFLVIGVRYTIRIKLRYKYEMYAQLRIYHISSCTSRQLTTADHATPVLEY